MSPLLSRSRPARYITAAAAALLVVSTLYYLQIPAGPPEHFSPGSFPPGRSADAPNAPPKPWPWQWQHPQSSPSPVWTARADQVKQAYRHAYGGYLKYASGFDELRPLSKTGQNNFNGWNVTMYDSLDTMLLMGLYDEFKEALPIVRDGRFDEIKNSRYASSKSLYAPFFETVIRYLGGLLAAYALSGEEILLEKADTLSTLLEPAFKTAHGLPTYGVNTATGQTSGGVSGVLAEIASCQLEWTYLAHATGKRNHFDAGNHVLQTLANAMQAQKGGMLATHWNHGQGKPSTEARSVGAAADSGHEYLLKQHLLTGKQDMAQLQMYILTTNEVLTRLLYMTPNREMLYTPDTGGSKFSPSHHFEHLSCFFPGLLALGAHTLPLNLSIIDVNDLNPEAQRQYRLLQNYDLRTLHMAAAEGLATSCYLLYAEMPSGLGPEVANMDHSSTLWIEALEKWRLGGMKGPLPGLNEKKVIPYQRTENLKVPTQPWDYAVQRGDYFLRPETLESIYIMWRVTNNPVWRERGWQIFQAIEKEAKNAIGYSSLRDVAQSPAPQADEQPSFFLAETLKYLYLLFTEDDPVPLDKWVFNTEAHPLPVFQWSDWEKHKFNFKWP